MFLSCLTVTGDCWDWEERDGVGTTYRTEVIRGSSVKKAEKNPMDTRIVRRELLL